MKERKIVCLTGMPGSGKSIIAGVAREKGIPVLVMGDVVREEATRRGLPHTPEVLNKIARELREKEGLDAVAKRIALKIEKLDNSVIVIDGVRSLDEIRVFEKYGRIVIIAVHASPKTRFMRIKERNRPGDPKTWEEFRERDLTELAFGIGNVIALADYMVVNEGSLDKVLDEARRVLEEVLKDGQDKS